MDTILLVWKEISDHLNSHTVIQLSRLVDIKPLILQSKCNFKWVK